MSAFNSMSDIPQMSHFGPGVLMQSSLSVSENNMQQKLRNMTLLWTDSRRRSDGVWIPHFLSKFNKTEIM